VAKPADARYSQRRMADCWPGSWRQGCGRTRAGPSADISLLSRGRGKLGADPVRTLFEHVAGPAARTGRPGMSCCGLRAIPVDRTTADVPDSEKNAGFGPSR
jgi:hypothetical protein